MEAIFDKYAQHYDSWFMTPAGRKVFDLELDTLIEFIHPSQGMKLLDVGIGTGLFSLEFARMGMDVSGIDPSEEMIAITRNRGLNAKIGAGEDIPFADNVFDVVLSMSSMEFSSDPDRFVSEMVRVARPCAPIVVAVLNLYAFHGMKRRIKGLLKKTIFSKAHFYSFWELKHLLLRHASSVQVTSSVFINPKPSPFILSRAEAVEKFGKRYLTPFGSLLVGRGIKK
jgi:ubiquinone/menaquinone biosynthesis C-methylase UbiE